MTTNFMPQNMGYNPNMGQNNYIINTIIATCLGSIAISLSQSFNILLKTVFEFLFFFISNKLSRLKNRFNKITGEVIIEGKKITNHGSSHLYLPNSYKAVMERMIEKNISLESITEMANDNFPVIFTSKNNDAKTDKKYIVLNNKNPKIELDKNIFVTFYRNLIHLGSQHDTTEEIYTITILSYVHNANYLSKYLDGLTKEYLLRVKIYDDGNIYYITQNVKNGSNSHNMYVMKTYKTFDNLFFEQKNRLLKKINYFLNNKQDYAKKGIPYTLGLLLHGEPGCGKTSFIKALSNLTKRHVLEINLKNISTCSEFVDAFRNETYNELHIPIEKKIIVLEDIDCMSSVISRKNANDVIEEIEDDSDDDKQKNDSDNKKQNDDKDSKNLFASIGPYDITSCIYKAENNKKDKNDKKKDKKNIDKYDKLTLSCILNTLDGVLEQYGRIVIITTNFLNRLDDALIRPGRIDEKIHFGKCTKNMCRDIIENFYDVELPKDIEFVENKYSPAELLEHCMSHYDNHAELLKKIQNI